MFKNIFTIFVIFISSAIFAEEVTIKATGDFAKELKALVEKYQASDINGSIEVLEQNISEQPIAEKAEHQSKEELIKRSPIEQAMQEDISLDNTNDINSTRKDYDRYFSDGKSGNKGVIDLLLDGTAIEGSASNGKILYESKCARCHGQKAEKSSYVNARNLITLPQQEILEQLRNYKKDSGYGQSTGLIMRAEATMISDEQMKDIAEYISSLKK
jgi:cytochrome c553